MRYLIITARLLMGLAFLVFGLNGFLHFIPQPCPSSINCNILFIIIKTMYRGRVCGWLKTMAQFNGPIRT